MSFLFNKIIPVALALVLLAILTVADYGASLKVQKAATLADEEPLLAGLIDQPQAIEQIAAVVAAMRDQTGTARTRNGDLGVFETLEILVRTPEILHGEAEKAVNKNLAMLDIRDSTGNLMTVDSPEFSSGVRHFQSFSSSGQSNMIENMINANLTKMKQTQAKLYGR